MDGYEFENLIGTMLKNMGFNVENTPLSGDGGIDLIATINKPIFKSTYLIQCKYWSSPVGEPAVRDLYGVVLANNANKGIVITNSTFSDKAIEFADNKNIELIDGKILNTLLNEYVNENNNIEITIPKSFIDFEEFEVDKYRYLTNRIERDKSNKAAYESLLHFYLNELHVSKIEMLKAGFLEEFINFIQEYINRFCKRTKTLLNEKKALQLILSQLYILKNDLTSALELIEDLGLFREKPRSNVDGDISRFLPYSYTSKDDILDNLSIKTKIVKQENKSFVSLIYLNLYQIFHEINYENGVVFLENIFEVYKISSLSRLEGEFSYFFDSDKIIPLNVNEFETILEQLKNEQFNNLYLPSSYEYDKNMWHVVTDNKAFSKDIFFKNMFDKTKIESQIPAIDLIIRTSY